MFFIKQDMRFTLLLLLALQLLFSCREKVTDNFGAYPKKPVINGFISGEGIVAIHVSWSAPVGRDTIPAINNAVVTISEENTPLMLIDEAEKGWYVAEIVPKPGRRYTCRVQVPGVKNEVVASTIMPANPIITSIQHKTLAGRDSDNLIYSAFKFTLQNNPSSRSYYQASVIYRVNDSTEKPARIVEMNDPVLAYEGMPYPLFSNVMMNGAQHTLTINYSRDTRDLAQGNNWSSMLEIKAVSEEYYKYAKSIEMYYNGLYPIFGITGYHAAPVYSNTSNGLGIFRAYTTWRSNIYLP